MVSFVDEWGVLRSTAFEVKRHIRREGGRRYERRKQEEGEMMKGGPVKVRDRRMKGERKADEEFIVQSVLPASLFLSTGKLYTEILKKAKRPVCVRVARVSDSQC